MRIERALKIRTELEMSLREIYSRAKSFGLPHSEIIEETMEARKRIAPPKTPEWVFSFIDGYHKALADSLYRESLVHGGLFDGVFYSTHSNRDDYYQKHGIQPSDFADDGKVKNRGHYWANHINKPYFIGQTTKEEQEQ